MSVTKEEPVAGGYELAFHELLLARSCIAVLRSYFALPDALRPSEAATVQAAIDRYDKKRAALTSTGRNTADAFHADCTNLIDAVQHQAEMARAYYLNLAPHVKQRATAQRLDNLTSACERLLERAKGTNTAGGGADA